MSIHKPKVVFLTNIPAPYRERMHEILAESTNINYSVIYCTKKEPNRQWEFENGRYKSFYLKERSNTYIHNNPNVIQYLNSNKPDIVIGTGFYPTILYGFLWCLFNRKIFLPYSDGTYKSEKKLSIVHKAVRKIVYKLSPCFIGASLGSFELYKSYNIPEKKIFRSCLCIENSMFSTRNIADKKYDIMFSGQLIDIKMPFFFVEIAKKIKDRLGHCKVLILGNGHLKTEVLNQLEEYSIEYNYPGFIQPKELHLYYNQAKVFLFPTKGDTWGIVANEACASGVPVITCDNAGAANDLIIHNKNGYVLPLDVDIWTEHVIKLLQNEELLNEFSCNAIEMVQPLNPDQAASGILEAINCATSSTKITTNLEKLHV